MTHSPARWLVVRVVSPSDDAISAIAEGLIAMGGAAVEQAGRRLTTWLPHDVEDAEAAEKVGAWFAESLGVAVEFECEVRDDEDWASKWREGLGPRRVGDRLIVAPSWTDPEPGPTDIVITIDPQMAFGTGEHASTRGVLRLMESAVKPGAKVLDIGTGSGVLAIAAAKLGAHDVLGVEMDGLALVNTRDNVVANACATRIQLEEATVDSDWLAGRRDRYDLIVANVLSGVLVPILGGLKDALTCDGFLVLGGIMDQEAAEVSEAARAAGLRTDREDSEDGWWSVRLARASESMG